MTLRPDEDAVRPTPRVLIVDDDADTLAMQGKVLTLMGVDAISVATRQAALQAAEALGRPDLVIADVNLPDGSGLACAAILKARYGCGTVIVSGYPAPDEGMRGGVEKWMMKPVSLDLLRATVERMLRRRSSPRAGGA